MSTTVLILDDEEKVLSALRRCFNRVDIHTDLFTSAKQAAASLVKKDYDCIISDYKMPDMNGLEFLEIASEVTSSTPRLLLSGQVDCGLLEKAVNDCNIDRFLNKPWLNEELVEIVKSAILLKKEEDDHKRMLANACKQIRLATTHQAATLPNPIDNAAIAADVLFRPVNELSGDVVDFDCDYRHFNFAISESAGNATVAAMEAYAMHKQIDLRDRLDPKSLIEALNNRYVSASSRHLFTMSLGTIEFATDTLTVCQAGAPNMYLIPSDPNRPIERLGVGGMPIGFSINEEYDVQQVQLSHDDCFIGFSENFTVSDTETLENLLAKTKRGCLKQLKGEVTSWCDSLLQTDDISAVFFKYKS